MNSLYQNALELEKKGIELYKKLTQESNNALAKKLFESLAEQEKYHIEVINGFLAKDSMLPEAKFVPLENQIKELYTKLRKETLGKDHSQAEGLEKAMQMEKEGYVLYAKALDSATDKNEKEFLQKLMAMEQEHYEALANLYYYYTSNDEWLSAEEAKTWNWMNL
jgi:rubrerythrin